MLPEFSLEETVEKLKELGYDGIEWRVHEDFHISPQEIKKKATYLGQLSVDSALEIVALATYLPEEKMDQIEDVMQAASMMGCPQVRVDVVPGYTGMINYHRLFDQTRKSLEKVSRLAQHYQVKANIEIHG